MKNILNTIGNLFIVLVIVAMTFTISIASIVSLKILFQA